MFPARIAKDQRDNVGGEGFLAEAQFRFFRVTRDNGRYFPRFEKRQHIQQFSDIVIRAIEEILVHVVGGIFFGIEPNGVSFGFSELFPVRIGNELVRQSVGGLSRLFPNQFHSRKDTVPLVGSSDLEPYAMIAVEPVKVIPHNEHVAEFGVRDRLVRVGNPLFDDILVHHPVHRHELADFAHEIEDVEVLEKDIVIDDFDLQFLPDFFLHMGQDSLYLFLDFYRIDGDLFDREKIPFIVFSAWIPNHSGRSSDDEKELVSPLHHMQGVHERDEIPQLQRIRRRIDSPVELLSSFFVEGKKFLVRVLMEESSAFELLFQIHMTFLMDITGKMYLFFVILQYWLLVSTKCQYVFDPAPVLRILVPPYQSPMLHLPTFFFFTPVFSKIGFFG